MLLMEYEHQYAFPPLIGPGKPRPLRRGFPLPGVDPGMGMFGPFPAPLDRIRIDRTHDMGSIDPVNPVYT